MTDENMSGAPEDEPFRPASRSADGGTVADAEDRRMTGRGTRPPAGRRGAPRRGRPTPGGPGGARPRGSAPRKRRGCLAAFALVLVLAAGGAGAVWWTLYKPVVDAPPGQAVQLEIVKGASTVDIAELLANSGVVANPVMFRLEVRGDEDTRPLRAGVYDLATGMDYRTVVDRLREGPPVAYFTLTIPEGWTIAQIAERVQEKSGVPAAEFRRLADTGAAQFQDSFPFLADNETGSLQGYLFPKTYRIKVGAGAADIAYIMLDQFAKEATGLDRTFAESRGLDMHAVVTIASIIEREARVDKDRPLISSVIYNRLKRGMLLEICATVQFVVGNKPRLLYSDLRVKSPYNTYLNKGLPPGPISSPGLASITAALAPTDTPYLYYVLTHKNGSHSFSTTLAEHNRYKAQAEKGLK
jgi:UPF0755 protein